MDNASKTNIDGYYKQNLANRLISEVISGYIKVFFIAHIIFFSLPTGHTKIKMFLLGQYIVYKEINLQTWNTTSCHCYVFYFCCEILVDLYHLFCTLGHNISVYTVERISFLSFTHQGRVKRFCTLHLYNSQQVTAQLSQQSGARLSL